MKGYRLARETTVKKHKLRNRLLLAGALLAVTALITGITMSKYITTLQLEPALADAEDFYFTSDLLKEEPENAEYRIDPQANMIEIQLSNSADLKRVTSERIDYEVRAEGAILDKTAGTLAGGEESTAKIVITPENSKAPVTVTVTTTYPYQKTLKATFVPAVGNYYTVEDKAGDTAAVLTVACTDTAGEIAVTLPNGVILDAANSLVEKKSDGGYIFHPPGKGVYSLVLLKSDTAVELKKDKTAFTAEIVITTP